MLMAQEARSALEDLYPDLAVGTPEQIKQAITAELAKPGGGTQLEMVRRVVLEIILKNLYPPPLH